MYTDPYEFKRSQQSQALTDHYNTYSRKDFNYLPDTNQSVYTNSSLSLVTFDLSSIYNSSRFTDTNDLVVVIPVCLVAAIAANDGVIIAPGVGSSSLLSMKSNYINLIHQCDIQINGKTCNDLQPYTNVLKNFEMLSEMSHSDLQIFGSTYGLGEVLDNPRSATLYRTNTTTVGQNGTGFCNNVPFGGAGTPTSTYPLVVNGSTSNTALASRFNTFVDASGATTGQQGLYGTTGIMPLSRLNAEFKPVYTVVGNCSVWYDYAIIRLGSILESLRNIGLTRRFDAVLRLYINTGSVAIPVTVTGGNIANLNYGQVLVQQSTFTNTCPFTVNYVPLLTTMTAATTQILAGCYLVRPAQSNLVAGAGRTAINITGLNIVHPLASCRIYYSSIEIGDPQKALTYIESNRAKKVVYRNFVSNFISNVSLGSSYSALIQSGLVNPVAVIVFPFISQASLFTTVPAGNHISQYGSPYDTAPATGSPLSITNFQVTVGGVNQLNTTLQYTYENFMQHVSIYDQIAGTDFGLSCGLFDRKYWEMNRAYVCLIRSKQSDMDTPRNINISFNNNSDVAADYMVFCVYLDSLIIDVDTGRITR